ncbi:hypothetical protein C7S15_4580 [Burkholderia cepacia]|nr:hypothetical protein [Burkholderia cepacia]
MTLKARHASRVFAHAAPAAARWILRPTIGPRDRTDRRMRLYVGGRRD